MAVLQMQRIFMCALKKDRKKLLELIQRRGVIEINDMLQEDSIFQKTDVSYAKIAFEKNISTANEACNILKIYAEEKTSLLSVLNGKQEVSTDQYDAFMDKHDENLRIANRIIALSKEIAENKAELLKLKTQLEMLTPWMELDIPMNFSGTKSTKSFIGILPKEWTYDTIYESLADLSPINVDIISASQEQTCIFVLCQKDKADAVYEVLRGMEFAHPSITFDKAPAEQMTYLTRLMNDANATIHSAEEEIKSYLPQKDNLMFLQDFDTMRAEKYEVIGHLLQSKNVFVITGFIPERDAQDLIQELNSKFILAIELEKPSEEDDVPVLLQNNAFSAPLEGVVAAYSPPGKGEMDPTFFMSLFYYLLFGIMLSDAGYGAVIAIACGIGLLKFGNKMEFSVKKTLRMYLFCGLSTVFWGIMFSSYFGDIVDVVSETFFGNKISIPPLWFIPMNEPMRMLTFAMAFGVVHLFTGLILKLYQLLKQKDYKAIIYDVVFWLVLLISSILLLLSMEMVTNLLGVNFIIPSSIANIAGILAILSAIGIIATNGRESKNPFKRFLKGLYALYGISGYLSDVLSYSRLLALGLATGVIGTVINKMAAMASGGKSIIGVIIFIIIVVLGHTLNLGINALGAYVHTNRLQYVEFFGKFYEGGGRLFQPFKENTKYYKIKE